MEATAKIKGFPKEWQEALDHMTEEQKKDADDGWEMFKAMNPPITISIDLGSGEDCTAIGNAIATCL